MMAWRNILVHAGAKTVRPPSALFRRQDVPRASCTRRRLDRTKHTKGKKDTQTVTTRLDRRAARSAARTVGTRKRKQHSIPSCLRLPVPAVLHRRPRNSCGRRSTAQPRHTSRCGGTPEDLRRDRLRELRGLRDLPEKAWPVSACFGRRPRSPIVPNVHDCSVLASGADFVARIGRLHDGTEWLFSGLDAAGVERGKIRRVAAVCRAIRALAVIEPPERPLDLLDRI